MSRLKRNRTGLPFFLFIITAVTLTALALSLLSTGGVDRYDREYNLARQQLAASQFSWSKEFLERQEEYGEWLSRHGTPFEARLFESFSRLLFSSASGIAADRSTLSFASRAYLSFLFALLRIAFIVIACWRLWTVAVLLASARAYYTLLPYNAANALGQTGNGRLFYSGIRAALDEVDQDGRPQLQVCGLACPATVSKVAAQNSPLGQLLAKYHALNDTNLALAGIILAHADWPAYVAEKEEQGVLAQMFSGASLADNAANLLKTMLQVHTLYRTGEETLLARSLSEADAKVSQTSAVGDVRLMDSRSYNALLKQKLHAVLTYNLRKHLSDLPPAAIATVALAHEAGKALTYSFDAGRWQRRSSFGQLNARAVLHSVPAYAAEYNIEAREIIRRALVYGSRKSVFAPVRFAMDMSQPSRALRQWVELLMACQHELQGVADEVELVGLVAESHEAWLSAFFDGAMLMNPDVVEGVYASSANLIFMPAGKILKLMRNVLEPEIVNRIDTLVSLASQRQKMQTLPTELAGENEERNGRTWQERLLEPLDGRAIRKIAELHQLSEADVREWSSLRVILNSYSWLARRVGDSTVPDSSIIFAVMHAEEERPKEANELGLIGKSGMVALRTSRLVARWGKSWANRFSQVGLANMAEDREQYERLLRGESELVEEEGQDTSLSGPQ